MSISVFCVCLNLKTVLPRSPLNRRAVISEFSMPTDVFALMDSTPDNVLTMVSCGVPLCINRPPTLRHCSARVAAWWLPTPVLQDHASRAVDSANRKLNDKARTSPANVICHRTEEYGRDERS